MYRNIKILFSALALACVDFHVANIHRAYVGALPVRFAWGISVVRTFQNGSSSVIGSGNPRTARC